LADYFYTFCDALITNCNYPQYTNDKIKKLKDKTSMANALDAENIIKDLFE
jgi:hypothetical protein